jgi:hypothetical protein
VAGGYIPRELADGLDAELALEMTRGAIRWYAVPGGNWLAESRRGRGRSEDDEDPERRAAFRDQAGRFTLPAETMLIRRMHALVAVVLSRLRASADWGAIAAEYFHGDPPATELGRAEAEFRSRRW